jgi:error-prone DNA polymerase
LLDEVSEPAAFCAALLNAQPLGFYAPAQLVADARRNGVRFLPVDVTRSDWDCTLERGDDGKPDVRLGLRVVGGLPEKEGMAIPGARQNDAFRSVEDLSQRARLTRRGIKVLADAGALATLTGHRHEARWASAGVQKFEGLLAGQAIAESSIELVAPNEGANIVADYRSMGLTLGRHPLELLRPHLQALRVVPSARLSTFRNNAWVRVAGIVTHRQRPGTASGVVFATLEDEFGIVSLIIWSKMFDQYRAEVLRSQLMMVRGRVQAEQGVIHVVAHEIEDRSTMLGALRTDSRDFH